MKKAWLSWSSGKDCAWALHVLRQAGEVEVAGLLTTFNKAANRVAMHAVKRDLVVEQARLAGVPLKAFDLPSPCSNANYQEIMAAACQLAASEGVEFIAFGDLFLEDVRAYREEQLKPTGLRPLFPLWGIPTQDLAARMYEGGLRALITCVDPRQLAREFAGCEWTDVKDHLPPTVDVCGERGEFHTFAHAGPMFSRGLPVQAGEIVERDGFVFADLISPSIRPAVLEDTLSIAELAEQLGYPLPQNEIARRLTTYQNDPQRCVLVAELGAKLVGWVDVSVATHLVSGRYGEIGGLIVCASMRGLGIGSRLVAAAEEWMKQQGVNRSVVRSRSTRVDAHRFYEREHYTLEKTSAVFGKKLF